MSSYFSYLAMRSGLVGGQAGPPPSTEGTADSLAAGLEENVERLVSSDGSPLEDRPKPVSPVADALSESNDTAMAARTAAPTVPVISNEPHAAPTLRRKDAGASQAGAPGSVAPTEGATPVSPSPGATAPNVDVQIARATRLATTPAGGRADVREGSVHRSADADPRVLLPARQTAAHSESGQPGKAGASGPGQTVVVAGTLADDAPAPATRLARPVIPAPGVVMLDGEGRTSVPPRPAQNRRNADHTVNVHIGTIALEVVQAPPKTMLPTQPMTVPAAAEASAPKTRLSRYYLRGP